MSTDYTFRKICAKRIREVREKTGETRKEFAKRLLVASSTYAKYETAETQPTFSTLVRIADIGNVSTDYLLGRTNAKEMQFSILDDLGLTQESAQVLAYLHDEEELGDFSDIINEIIEHEYFIELMIYIRGYLCIKSKAFNTKDFYATYDDFENHRAEFLAECADAAGFEKTDIPVILTDSKMATRMYRYEAVGVFDRIICKLKTYQDNHSFLDWLYLNNDENYRPEDDHPF